MLSCDCLGEGGSTDRVARGQMFMCCAQNPKNINSFVRVPGREDRWLGWPRNCLCVKCLCASSGPYSKNIHLRPHCRQKSLLRNAGVGGRGHNLIFLSCTFQTKRHLLLARQHCSGKPWKPLARQVAQNGTRRRGTCELQIMKVLGRQVSRGACKKAQINRELDVWSEIMIQNQALQSSKFQRFSSRCAVHVLHPLEEYANDWFDFESAWV